MVFDKVEVNVGQLEGNDIILSDSMICDRHCRILFQDNKFTVIDLNSYNGTFVNGHRLHRPLIIYRADRIYVGAHILNVERLDEQRSDTGWTGLEGALRTASVDEVFRGALLDERDVATDAWGFDLSDSERQMLLQVPDPQLRTAVDAARHAALSDRPPPAPIATHGSRPR